MPKISIVRCPSYEFVNDELKKLNENIDVEAINGLLRFCLEGRQDSYIVDHAKKKIYFKPINDIHDVFHAMLNKWFRIVIMDYDLTLSKSIGRIDLMRSYSAALVINNNLYTMVIPAAVSSDPGGYYAFNFAEVYEI